VHRISALICIATPFSYVTPSAEEESDYFTFAVAAVIGGILAFLAMEYWPAFGEPGWPRFMEDIVALLVVCEFLVPILVAMFAPAKTPAGGFDTETISRAVRTFIFRATRDEAALTLSLAQALGLLLKVPHVADYKPTKKFRFFPGLSSWGVTLTLLPIVTFCLWYFPNTPITFAQFSLLAVIETDAASGALFLLAFTIVAASVGFWDILSWRRTTIEVDAAPLLKECTFMSYSDLEDMPTTTLRHGLYEHKELQRELGLIIREVAFGGRGGNWVQR
jgi:hypothetical protein